MEFVHCIPVVSSMQVLDKLLSEEKNAEYKIMGSHIFDLHSGEFVEIETYPFTPNLIESFYYSRKSNIDEGFLEEIAKHETVIYLFSNMNNLEYCINLIESILKTTGIAVKNEITGKSFTLKEWQLLSKNICGENIFDYFTNIIQDEKDIYTVGMNSFEMPDVVLPTNSFTDREVKIVCEVGRSLLIDWSKGKLNQNYKYEVNKDYRFEENDLTHNAYGLMVVRI